MATQQLARLLTVVLAATVCVAQAETPIDPNAPEPAGAASATSPNDASLSDASSAQS